MISNDPQQLDHSALDQHPLNSCENPGLVLVTGASGGIGRAIALAFAHKGCVVALHYNTHREEALAVREEVHRLGGCAEVFQADLTQEEQVSRLFRQVEHTLGEIRILVNNAGIAWQGLFTDMSLTEWRQVLDVNLTSVFLCCRRALPSMICRKEGCIINISSMWGQQGASCEAAYSAAKAGVIGLTQALAREEGPSGIRVNCIAPGVIDTPMNIHLSPEDLSALQEETPLLALGTPENVAHAAVFLAENQFITGQTLGVNGGFL